MIGYVRFLWVCIFVASFLLAQSPQGSTDASESARSYAEELASVARGERIYARACEACHGANGDGNGPAAAALNPRPRDFTQGMYKFRSTPGGTLPTRADLFRSVSEGIPRTFMPAWKNLLSEQDIRDVVAYIESFSEQFQKWGAGTPISIPEPPEATEERVFEGEQVYKIMECWSCHGANGKGNGPSASDLTDDWGYPIKPFDFTTGKYKSGSTAVDIYRTINTGLNGTPMPAYREDFLFPKEAFEDLANLQEVYSSAEIEELQEYAGSVPTEEEIEAMTDEQREALAEQRRWSLVYYLQSLSRKGGLFYTLFIENTDETK